MGLRFGFNMSDTASERSKRKRRRVAGELANVCPHIGFVQPTTNEDGTFAFQVQYLFETFFGTTSYFCAGCGTAWSRFTIQMYHDQLQASFGGRHGGNV